MCTTRTEFAIRLENLARKQNHPHARCAACRATVVRFSLRAFPTIVSFSLVRRLALFPSVCLSSSLPPLEPAGRPVRRLLDGLGRGDLSFPRVKHATPCLTWTTGIPSLVFWFVSSLSLSLSLYLPTALPLALTWVSVLYTNSSTIRNSSHPHVEGGGQEFLNALANEYLGC